MEDLGDELERLARLKSDGHITEDEFEALKARLPVFPVRDLRNRLPAVDQESPAVDQEPPVVNQDPLDPHICTHCGWVAPFVGGPAPNLYFSNCAHCGMKHPVGPTGVVQPVGQVSVTNSLEALFPEVAAQWHATKNGDVTPDQVVAGSMKKFWWKCPVADDHVWLAQVKNRTHAGRGCPFCSGLKERMKGESSPQEQRLEGNVWSRVSPAARNAWSGVPPAVRVVIIIILCGWLAGMIRGACAESPVTSVEVPDFLCIDLQEAQDRGRRPGRSFHVTSWDARPNQNRMRLWDRNWIVIKQEPEAGTTVSIGANIHLGVVKESEAQGVC
mgnify:FL=1